MERQSLIKGELQQMGVAKVDLAYKAVQPIDVSTAVDGRITAKQGGDEMEWKEYLSEVCVR